MAMSTAITTTAAPSPMPAFAPVDKPDESLEVEEEPAPPVEVALCGANPARVTDVAEVVSPVLIGLVI